MPAPIAHLAYQNRTVIYGLLFDMANEVLLTIAADPKHLGARIGATLVLHTWVFGVDPSPACAWCRPWWRHRTGR